MAIQLPLRRPAPTWRGSSRYSTNGPSETRKTNSMASRKRNHNHRLVKYRRTYTFREIGELFGVHIRTVRSWRKAGLQVLPDSRLPALVLGGDLRTFLQVRRESRRCRLGDGQFYCQRCRCGRLPNPESSTVENSGRRLGNDFEQIIFRGKCSVCGAKMVRFGSRRIGNPEPKQGDIQTGSNTVIRQR